MGARNGNGGICNLETVKWQGVQVLRPIVAVCGGLARPTSWYPSISEAKDLFNPLLHCRIRFGVRAMDGFKRSL